MASSTDTMLTDEEIISEFGSDGYQEGDRDLAALVVLRMILHSTYSGSYLKKTIYNLLATTDLRQKLLAAFRSGRFEPIREVLRQEFGLERPPDKVVKKCYSTMDLLRQSFESPFLGNAHEGLFEYLTENDRLFERSLMPGHAGRFCSIVQSSGTGKSRVMLELRNKGVIVLYISLRKKEHIVYPSRDELLADILTGFPDTEEEYAKQICALFTAIFKALQDRFAFLMQAERVNGTPPVEAWNKTMCDLTSEGRNRFFREVKSEYQNVLGSISKSDTTLGQETLVDEYHKWLKCSAGLFDTQGDPNNPQLVIAIHGARYLTVETHGCTSYRPLDVVCRVISTYSKGSRPTWVVFASTSSHVANVSPSSLADPAWYTSQKILFPPYVHLGWDHYAVDIRSISPSQVPEFWYIASMGRPLWHDLINVENEALSLMETVRNKLCGAYQYDPDSTDSALAVLGARFCLAIRGDHPNTDGFLTRAVATHMRVLRTTSARRSWWTSKYPSEPLVACAAASLLHQSDTTQYSTLTTLRQKIKDGMVDIERCGGLVSRLLLQIGKDLLARKFYTRPLDMPDIGKGPWEVQLPDCRPIPVVEFLECLFGPSVWEHGGRDEFAHWRINFSHWIPMTGKIWEGSGDESLPGRCDLIIRHWFRTSAIQCSSDQALVDKVIPLYCCDPSGPSDRFSQLLISDRASDHFTGPELDFISPQTTIGRDTTEPYVVIRLDMNTGELEDLPIAANFTPGCLRIRVNGITKESFPFLEDRDNLAWALAGILDLERPTGNTSTTISQLGAKVDFGETVAHKHMLQGVKPGCFESYSHDNGLSSFWES